MASTLLAQAISSDDRLAMLAAAICREPVPDHKLQHIVDQILKGLYPEEFNRLSLNAVGDRSKSTSMPGMKTSLFHQPKVENQVFMPFLTALAERTIAAAKAHHIDTRALANAVITELRQRAEKAQDPSAETSITKRTLAYAIQHCLSRCGELAATTLGTNDTSFLPAPVAA